VSNVVEAECPAGGAALDGSLLDVFGLKLGGAVVEVIPVVQQELAPGSQLLGVVMARVGGRQNHQERAG
jgi:hypothetical protein